MKSKLTIGILDQTPIPTGSTAVEAMKQTIQLAQAADRLGFSRYWVAEHHNSEGFAGSSPEVLAAAIAAQTSRIRVGSGGVLLPHYSPYKVAENFRVLEALFPGRIDLGIGRAPGGMPLSSQALRYGRTKIMDPQLPAALTELADYLHDRIPSDHPLASLRATPIIDTAPEIWLLGSTSISAKMASELGGSFAFAHFINGDGDDGLQAVGDYREGYRPGPLGSEPRVSVAVHVICADTADAAERFARAFDLRMLLLEQGHYGSKFPSDEEVKKYPYTDWDRTRIRENRKRMIVGDPESVRELLLQFSNNYGVDEIIAVTITREFTDRLRSYELLADLFLADRPL